MKKFIMVFFAVFACLAINAQYKQPQWLMPLEFLDGNGDRDTVYIGYDPSASPYPEVMDTIFNERWIVVDTSKFNVYLLQYPGYSPTSILTTDTVKKINIQLYIGSEIGFIKGKMPVTLKWVDTLLNSPGLPFPDISPRPRARIDVYCGSGEPGYFNCPNGEDPISLTNYVTQDIPIPVSDSLFFNGSGNDYYNPRNAIGTIVVEVVPHNYHTNRYNIPQEEEIFNVFPNPFKNEITFFNYQELLLDITLLNPLGLTLYYTSTNMEHITINTTYIEEGICFLIIQTKDRLFIKKLIKM
jgi:hypothetical protein